MRKELTVFIGLGQREFSRLLTEVAGVVATQPIQKLKLWVNAGAKPILREGTPGRELTGARRISKETGPCPSLTTAKMNN